MSSAVSLLVSTPRPLRCQSRARESPGRPAQSWGGANSCRAAMLLGGAQFISHARTHPIYSLRHLLRATMLLDGALHQRSPRRACCAACRDRPRRRTAQQAIGPAGSSRSRRKRALASPCATAEQRGDALSAAVYRGVGMAAVGSSRLTRDSGAHVLAVRRIEAKRWVCAD